MFSTRQPTRSLTVRRGVSVALLGGLVALSACGSGRSDGGTAAPSTASTLPTGSNVNAPITAPAGDTTWLCHPGLKIADPCRGDLTTTVVMPDGTSTVEELKANDESKVDCFYVYPTVTEEAGMNADDVITPAQQSVAVQQAAQFSPMCRMYAPMYPQFTVAASTGSPAQQAAYHKKAYDGVVAGWKEYLADANHGRKFVLLGHSQGAAMLTRLIANEIDPKPALRKQLVSAVLLGGNVRVPKGKDVGGDFKHIPACRTPGQAGCVIAYSTFNETPPADSYFGGLNGDLNGLFASSTGKNLEVLCTNPANLAGGPGEVKGRYATKPSSGVIGALLGQVFSAGGPPTAKTAWVEPSTRYTAECKSEGGTNTLRVTPVGNAPVLVNSPAPNWGLHLVDVNLSLGTLLDDVAAQIQTASH